MDADGSREDRDMANNIKPASAGIDYAGFYKFCIELNRHIYDEALKKGIETVNSRVTVLGDVEHPVFEVNIRMRQA